MLHQISSYMDEQREMCAVTPWPPLKYSQRLSSWLMFPVCSYGCSWAYACVFCFLPQSLNYSCDRSANNLSSHQVFYSELERVCKTLTSCEVSSTSITFFRIPLIGLSLLGVWGGGGVGFGYIRWGRSMPGQDGNEYGCCLVLPICCHLVLLDNSLRAQKKYSILLSRVTTHVQAVGCPLIWERC